MNRFLRNYTVVAVISLIISFLATTNALATHLRAGEITVKRISATSLTYRITLTTYTDQIGGVAANEAANTYKIFFGIGNIHYDVQRRKKILINPATVLNVYDTVFTYPAQGTYKISCSIQNRNANTVNLPPPTEQISFFVSTTLVVNGALGLNRSPVLLNAPLDSGGVGKRFIHNPGAFDADGDSLAYRLTTCQRDVSLNSETGIGEFIPGYRDPASVGTPPLLNQDGTAPASLIINPLTGDLIWDAPRQKGQYNVAFIVEEWRKGLDGTYIKIGEIIRDMQIIVVESPNNPPVITVPPNICIEAGKTVNFKVSAVDKDNNNIRITTSGGVYNLDASGNKADFVPIDAATFTPVAPNNIQKSPATGTFNWATNCNHVRQQPYDVVFRVEDFPGRFAVQFTDIKTIKITVVAPRPVGLAVKSNANGNNLTWQKYPNCNVAKSQLIVYRKEGCTNFQPSDCVLGLPASLGYKEIARVSSTDTAFLDKTALTNTIYSYRIVGSLSNTDFIENLSVTSNEACIGSIIPQTMPVMTNVSIDQTSTTAGQITVKWTRPLNFDSTKTKGPYQYRLSRAIGASTLDFTQIAIFTKLTDTVFVDKNLNTTQNVYRYKIAFDYTESNAIKNVGETAVANSVRLTATPSPKQVQLNWEAIVPWSNENQTHRIYREVRGKPGVFNKIAEIGVLATNTFSYVDNGTDRFPGDGNATITLSTDSTYCYKIETVGTYSNLKLGLLNNFSQVACASVLPAVDNTPPCSPVLSLDPLDCKNLDRKQLCDPNFFKNLLKWQNPTSSACKQTISQYKIYFAKYKDDKFLLLTTIANGDILSYAHQKTPQEGFIGCYYVTAINSQGIESAASNIVCNDNCPFIEFPNVFTPNGDGKNDVFAPLDCPAFTQVISIEIYNRNGLKVYENTAPTLAWDGKTNGGVELPTGTYFYVVKVQFVRWDKSNTDTTTINGMVELIR